MRPLSACKACRERRKKCLRARQGISCDFCVRRNITCVMDKEPASTLTTPKGYAPLFEHDSNRGILMSSAVVPDPELSQELVDIYFRHVHISLPSLFHRADCKSAVKDGTIPKILFLGIVSLSARFSLHPSFDGIEPWDRGRPYAQEAEKLLNLHDTSVTTIQACILLAWIFQVEGEPNTESVYYAIASRMAVILDLPNTTKESFIQQEINRRIWWSLVTMDTWHSASLCIPRTLSSDDKIQLPMDEWEFIHLDPQSDGLDVTENTQSHQTPESSVSLLGYMVKLNRLLYDVNRLNSTIVAGSVQGQSANDSVMALLEALHAWKHSLPAPMVYNKQNLSEWADQGLGPTFLSLHLNYNNIGLRLFYQFLYFSQRNTNVLDENSTFFADKCKTYATNICEIVSEARKRSDTELRFSFMSHMLVLASTVQLHTLLFSPEDQDIKAAKSRLEQNFEVLILLYSYWPNVSVSLSKLKAFHSACLRSSDSSFCLDRWMLQFILEFSRPLMEKEDTPLDDGLWTSEKLRYLLL